MKKLNNKGFSLVELIIVIAIMAILVGVVGTQVIPYLESSRQGKDMQVFSAWNTAAMSAYSMNADTAPSTGTVTISVAKSGAITISPATETKILQTFATLVGATKGGTDAAPTYNVDAFTNLASKEARTAVTLDHVDCIIDCDNATVTTKMMVNSSTESTVFNTIYNK